jgi:hypothetical protein
LQRLPPDLAGEQARSFAEQAVEHLQAAVALRPRSGLARGALASAQAVLAVITGDQSAFAQIVALMQSATDVDPDNEIVWFLRAEFLRRAPQGRKPRSRPAASRWSSSPASAGEGAAGDAAEVTGRAGGPVGPPAALTRLARRPRHRGPRIHRPGHEHLAHEDLAADRRIERHRPDSWPANGAHELAVDGDAHLLAELVDADHVLAARSSSGGAVNTRSAPR